MDIDRNIYNSGAAPFESEAREATAPSVPGVTSTSPARPGSGRVQRASALKASQRVSSWAEREAMPFTAVAGRDIFVTSKTKAHTRRTPPAEQPPAAAKHQRTAQQADARRRDRRRSPSTPEPGAGRAASDAKRPCRARGGQRASTAEDGASGSDSEAALSGDELYGCPKCRYAWKGCGACRARRPAFVRPRELRWRPEEGRPQAVPAGRTYRPSAEEFADPVAYIARITGEACGQGAAHIIPPPGWDPPFALERGTTGTSMESFRFAIRRQPTAKLCVRGAGVGKGSGGGGGGGATHAAGRCAGRALLNGAGGVGDGACAAGDGAREDTMHDRMDADASADEASSSGSDSDSESEFGFPTLQRRHTLRSFSAYADWARALHFSGAGTRAPSGRSTPVGEGAPGTGAAPTDCDAAPAPTAAARSWQRRPRALAGPAAGTVPEPTLEQVEAEFWRLVETPRPEDAALESLYGQDLDSGLHGSGFPLPAWRRALLEAALRARGASAAAAAAAAAPPDCPAAAAYAEAAWNVNNMPRGRGSVLRHALGEELITGVMVPWLYVGSALSAFAWHVEDHALYSVNYHHMGAEKVWYTVPPSATRALEDAMRDALPGLFAAAPGLIYQLVTLLSPAELRARGVPVYRFVQRPGEFMITMPDSYHAGFNAGFNCAEAVNFAPAEWIPYGTDILDKYRQSGKPLTLSHDSLLVALVQGGARRGAAAPARAGAEERGPPGGGVEREDGGGAGGPSGEAKVEGYDEVKTEAVCGAGRLPSGEEMHGAVPPPLAGLDGLGAGPARSVPDARPASARKAASTAAAAAPSQQVPLLPPPPEAVALAAGDVCLRATEERRRLSAGCAALAVRSRSAEGADARSTCVEGVGAAGSVGAAESAALTRWYGAVERMPPRAAAASTSGARPAPGPASVTPTRRRSARGLFADTADMDCCVCACDLWLSAALCTLCPDLAACPEHVAALLERAPGGAPPGDARACLVLLQRHTPEELEAMVAAAGEGEPGVWEAVRAARSRRGVREATRVRHRSLGPFDPTGKSYSSCGGAAAESDARLIPELKPTSGLSEPGACLIAAAHQCAIPA
ncbi:hypothetical protein ACKKBF_B05720 [Auxenochlorella protothecoides x Auxenochlorella symbiontica]